MKSFPSALIKLPDELLKRTTSGCLVCHAPCPAEVWRTGGIPSKVFLKRTCPEHGEATVCIASDARFYWLAKGKPENGVRGSACCSAGPNANPSREGSRISDGSTNAVPLLGGDRGGVPQPPAATHFAG